MTLHPNDSFPPEFMDVQREDEVVRFVLAQPWPGTYKARIMKGWYRALGVPVNPRAVDEVEKSGP